MAVENSSSFFFTESLEMATRYKIARLREYPDIVPDEPGCFGIGKEAEISYVDWTSSLRQTIQEEFCDENASTFLERDTAMVSSTLKSESQMPEFDAREWLQDSRVRWSVCDVPPIYKPPRPLLLASKRTARHAGQTVARVLLYIPSSLAFLAISAVYVAILIGAVLEIGKIGTGDRRASAPSGAGVAADRVAPDLPAEPESDEFLSDDSYLEAEAADSSDCEYQAEVGGDSYECRQEQWDLQEGADSDDYQTAFDAAVDEGCEALFLESSDGELHFGSETFSPLDCVGALPVDASFERPMEVPDDPGVEGSRAGFDAGCDALFEMVGYDELYSGYDSFSPQDCQVFNPH